MSVLSLFRMATETTLSLSTGSLDDDHIRHPPSANHASLFVHTVGPRFSLADYSRHSPTLRLTFFSASSHHPSYQPSGKKEDEAEREQSLSCFRKKTHLWLCIKLAFLGFVLRYYYVFSRIRVKHGALHRLFGIQRVITVTAALMWESDIFTEPSLYRQKRSWESQQHRWGKRWPLWFEMWCIFCTLINNSFFSSWCLAVF